MVKYFFVFLAILSVITGVTAIFYEIEWLQKASQLCVVLSFFGLYFNRLPKQKLNFYGFLSSLVAANFVLVFYDMWYFFHIAVGFWLVGFGFLIKEAIQYTQYSRGSYMMQIYFVLVVAVYACLISLHLIEIEHSVDNGLQFFMYILYYFNLLILGVTALVYYLNSFSKKSVYFICFVISLIFSDVLRDMGVFYFRDLSVEVAGALIKFAAINLIFLFFVTKEKKLRLLNLV